MRSPFYIGLFVVMLSCSGVQSSSKTAKDVKLKNYRTYAWVAPDDAETAARADDRQYAKFIQQQADAALQRKGMVRDTLQPDAVFTFETRVEERAKYTQSPTVSVGFGFGGPGYYGGFGAPVAGGQVFSRNYEQGMLMIQMMDTKSKRVIWTGFAQKELTAESDIEKDIRTAVRDIFARLPIKHKK